MAFENYTRSPQIFLLLWKTWVSPCVETEVNATLTWVFRDTSKRLCNVSNSSERCWLAYYLCSPKLQQASTRGATRWTVYSTHCSWNSWIASRQSKPTSLIKKEVERFSQYANKWPDATMRIRASNMKLVCHSDGSYLSESEARGTSYSWAIVQITRHLMHQFVFSVLSSKLWSRQLLQPSTQQHSSLVKLPLASSIH